MLYKSLFTLLTRSCRQPHNSITPISNLYVTHLSSNAWLGSLYKRALLGYHTYLRSLWDWNFFSLFMYHYPNGLVARENAQELIWTRNLLLSFTVRTLQVVLKTSTTTYSIVGLVIFKASKIQWRVLHAWLKYIG